MMTMTSPLKKGMQSYFKSLPSGLLDTQLQVFDTPMEEHAFVSTILEDDENHHHYEEESNDCLPLSFKIL